MSGTEKRKVMCCGKPVDGELQIVKLGDDVCAVAGIFCKSCGKIFSEFNMPLTYREKTAFWVKGEIVLR